MSRIQPAALSRRCRGSSRSRTRMDDLVRQLLALRPASPFLVTPQIRRSIIPLRRRCPRRHLCLIVKRLTPAVADPALAVAVVVRPLRVHVRFQQKEKVVDARLVEDRDEVDARESGEELGPLAYL